MPVSKTPCHPAVPSCWTKVQGYQLAGACPPRAARDTSSPHAVPHWAARPRPTSPGCQHSHTQSPGPQSIFSALLAAVLALPLFLCR